MTQRERVSTDLRSYDDMNVTHSVNADYSHLLNQSNNKSQGGKNNGLYFETYTIKDIQESKSIVDKFLMKDQMKTNMKKPGSRKVFTRLHQHAVVKQRKTNELRAKQNNLKSQKAMMHSKSTYLKKYTVDSIDCGAKKAKKHTRTSTKDLQYNASAGHRLYVKSRGQSSKREQSIRRRTTMESEVTAKDLCRPTLMSSNSKYLADKMLTEPFWSARTWNKSDFDKERR